MATAWPANNPRAPRTDGNIESAGVRQSCRILPVAAGAGQKIGSCADYRRRSLSKILATRPSMTRQADAAVVATMMLAIQHVHAAFLRPP